VTQSIDELGTLRLEIPATVSTLEAAKQSPAAMEQLQVGFDKLQQLNPGQTLGSPTTARGGLLHKARSTLGHLATSLAHVLAGSLEGSSAASPVLTRPVSTQDEVRTPFRTLVQTALEQDGVKDVYVILAAPIE
jgi:hypothetical protein